MRPLRLRVKGFTAFRDPVELDFTDVDVFAISGPTGSGKSSLLDAMTYALYGRVERVGDRVGQLISQGQPRMAVTLEFEVGRERYRATRSTASNRGATKILLERQEPDGEWRQAGQGADRVREAGPMIARAIGLTYEGFTRSVLLPQGTFAEFLVGDARKRRDILTELLGLSLFRRMAERAGAFARSASEQAQWTSSMLDREFADATPEALKEAERAATEARERERAVAGAAEQVLDRLRRWEEARRSVEELRACAEEADLAAGQLRAAEEDLAGLADQIGEAVARVDRCRAASRAAQESVRSAEAALRDAEANLAPTDELSRAQLWAHALAEALRARRRKESERARVEEAAERLAQAVERAEAVSAARREAVAAREGELHLAEAALEEARHADLVTAVSAGLRAGDPCPVCGLPLDRAPRVPAAGALDRATRRLAKARKLLEGARKDVSEAERAADAARRDQLSNAADQARVAAQIEELDDAVVAQRASLVEVLGDPLPEDPAEEIERRLAQRQRLDRADREARAAAARATQAALEAERDRDRVGASIDRHRDRLALDRGPFLERAARAMGQKSVPMTLPPLPDRGDASALRDHAGQLAGALAAFGERLGTMADERGELEHFLLEEANQAVDGLVEPAVTLDSLAEATNDACRAAAAAVATTAQRAEDLADKLARKRQIEGEVQALDERARLFRALALELRADHLIAFLQAEALQVLAAAGSERLSNLSEGRYRLACRQDEFVVVDTWNGDEERSVRTLSGGETFLASLALALALADQVRSISVTDRARLDSLFLDEGFGTLDAETLRVVVDAIEQLAGDGRLVGVITHVSDLAEQFPRVEVKKSPRGSRLQLVR